MNTRVCVSLTIVLAMLLAVSGCGIQTAGDLMSGVRTVDRPLAPAEPERGFVDSATAFSWRFFQEECRQEGNILVSPASAYLALAMALNGAGGTTRDAMLQALSAESLMIGPINTGCRDWSTLLMDTDGKTDLRIANSIWFDDGFAADPDFLETNAGFYSADLRQLDFADGKSAETINDWVRKATDGKIDRILDQTDPGDAAYLLNAVYFKSSWQDPFSRTYQGTFHARSGTVTASYMYRKSETGYLASDGLVGVRMPFVSERLSFFAVLPGEGVSARDAFNRMDAAAFQRLLGSEQQVTVVLHMPKFEVEYKTDLTDSLTRLGMGVAFQPDADFSLMQKEQIGGLYITGGSQKTFFRIDEKGAEAAAVTGMTFAAATTGQDGHELVFDRPFLYGIVDAPTGIPLFIGIMENPVG